MIHEWNIWVVGGDLRQAKLAEMLRSDGHTVHTFALELTPEPDDTPMAQSLEGVELAHCVVLPLPVAGEEGMLNAPLCAGKHPLSEILDALSPNQVVCAGLVGPKTAELAHKRNLKLHDYFAREELAVKNAIPTAEGAVQIAMEELPITIHGSRVLIIGYRRLGKLLAPLFGAGRAGDGDGAQVFRPGVGPGLRLRRRADRAAGRLAVRLRPGGQYGARPGAG
jgi:dipicolinate synthase subunit A